MGTLKKLSILNLAISLQYFSQGGTGTTLHVYLQYLGAIEEKMNENDN